MAESQPRQGSSGHGGLASSKSEDSPRRFKAALALSQEGYYAPETTRAYAIRAQETAQRCMQFAADLEAEAARLEREANA